MPSYCTLTLARKTMLSYSTTVDDTDLADYIPFASDLIDNYCGQNFDERVESFGFSGEVGAFNPSLYLDKRPLLSISTLTNGNGDVITAASYVLLPKFRYPKEYIRLVSGSFWRGPGDPATSTDCVSLGVHPLTLAQYAVDAVEVVGTWGFVPHYTTAWTATSVNISSASGTSLTLATAPGTAFDVGSVLRATVSGNNEQMRVTGPIASFSTATTITVERAYNGTTQNSYASSTALSVFQVPYSIQLAAAEWVAAIYQGRQNPTGDRVNVGGFSAVLPVNIPGKVIDKLRWPYFNEMYGRPNG